jgi:hydroxymethylpyrimidine/phosphomethylpyrimidine kinase
MISNSKSSVKWHLRLDRTANPTQLQPKELVHQIRSQRQDPDGTIVLADSSLKTDVSAGWWLAVEEPDGVFGWFAVPAIGNQMIVASILTTKEGWKMYGATLHQSLKSISILDPIALVNEKMASLDASSAILANLNEQSLQALVGLHEWRRVQEIAENGAVERELGYMQVSVTTGNRKAINDLQTETSDPADGIIVTIRSRILPNPETGVIVDAVGLYWMSWDGKDERWTNRITRWLDRVSAVQSETGIRSRARLGMANPSLLVMQQDLTSNAIETPFQSTTEDPWLPSALVWVIGPVLKTSTASAFIWHAYDNTVEPKIATRSDVVTSNTDGTKTITTSFGIAGDEITTTVDHTGRLVKQVQQGNLLITGSTKETLRQIWQPKNLW